MDDFSRKTLSVSSSFFEEAFFRFAVKRSSLA